MNVTQTTMPRRESNTDYDQQPEAFTSVQLRNRTVMLSQKQSHRNSQSFDSEDVDKESLFKMFDRCIVTYSCSGVYVDFCAMMVFSLFRIVVVLKVDQHFLDSWNKLICIFDTWDNCLESCILYYSIQLSKKCASKGWKRSVRYQSCYILCWRMYV